MNYFKTVVGPTSHFRPQYNRTLKITLLVNWTFFSSNISSQLDPYAENSVPRIEQSCTAIAADDIIAIYDLLCKYVIAVFVSRSTCCWLSLFLCVTITALVVWGVLLFSFLLSYQIIWYFPTAIQWLLTVIKYKKYICSRAVARNLEDPWQNVIVGPSY